MPRIRITTLTDKMKDEQVLSKLKGLGAKTKDKDKERAEESHDETKEKLTATGEKVIEKRVASTVIRRRVQAPPPPVVEEKKEEAKPAEEAPAAKAPRKRKVTLKKAAAEAAAEPAVVGPEAVPAEAEAVQPAAPADKAEERRGLEAVAEAARPAEEGAKEEPKPDLEIIPEDKKQAITRDLEEVYKDDLHKEVKLEEEPEEEKKRKKAERLLKKIEEEELEASTTKKKGLLKRKVVIREEDLYAFRRQRGKTLPFRKGGRGRIDARAEDEARPELRIARKAVRIGDRVQVGELAKRLSVKAQDVIAKLLALGIMSNINQSIDYETAYMVATDLGFDVEKILSMEEEFEAKETEAR